MNCCTKAPDWLADKVVVIETSPVDVGSKLNSLNPLTSEFILLFK